MSCANLGNSCPFEYRCETYSYHDTYNNRYYCEDIPINNLNT